jgi:hypothetical protein
MPGKAPEAEECDPAYNTQNQAAGQAQEKPNSSCVVGNIKYICGTFLKFALGNGVCRH